MIAWDGAVDHFATSQRAAGIGEETIERRVRHVRQFAAHTDATMDSVAREDVEAWLQSQAIKTLTATSMRDSLRAFFRWAANTNRVASDPIEGTHRMQRAQAPAAWEPEIRAWERHLRGAGRAESTIRQQGVYLRGFARDNARVAPWEVTTELILDWFSTKRWGRETRRGRRSALRGFYAWAKDTKRIRKDPAKKVPVMKAERGMPRPAADDHVTVALALADERERLAIRLAADLGLRCAEVAGLHSTDLRERDGMYSLRVRGKGSKERMVPVPADLARAIRVRGAGFLFPGDYNGHISPNYLGKRVNQLLPAGVTMHMLRHRFATIAYNVERDTFTVQRLLGHASPATTQIYVQLDDDVLRGTVEAVHRHRGGIDRARAALAEVS